MACEDFEAAKLRLWNEAQSARASRAHSAAINSSLHQSLRAMREGPAGTSGSGGGAKGFGALAAIVVVIGLLASQHREAPLQERAKPAEPSSVVPVVETVLLAKTSLSPGERLSLVRRSDESKPLRAYLVLQYGSTKRHLGAFNLDGRAINMIKLPDGIPTGKYRLFVQWANRQQLHTEGFDFEVVDQRHAAAESFTWWDALSDQSAIRPKAASKSSDVAMPERHVAASDQNPVSADRRSAQADSPAPAQPSLYDLTRMDPVPGEEVRRTANRWPESIAGF